MIKIEKHNAHGLQLLVSLTPNEALYLAEKLIQATRLTQDADRLNYFKQHVKFEDDNDIWADCHFDFVVDSGEGAIDCVKIS